MYNSDLEERQYTPPAATWLPVLFTIHLISLPLTFLAAVTGWRTILTWITGVLSTGSILALFRLTPENQRYRTAAIFSCIVFFGNMINPLGGGVILSLVVSVCSIIAMYQEYVAHSELCAGIDAVLSRKWHSLFTWKLIVGLLSGFLSSAGVVIAVLVGMDSEAIVTVAVVFIGAVSAAMEVFYLCYLRRLQKALPKESF